MKILVIRSVCWSRMLMRHRWTFMIYTPDFRARRIVHSDVTSRIPTETWASVLFETMHKRQADMEFLRRACRRQYASEFGGERAGTCPHCGVYIIYNLACHVMDHHLELGQLWRCPLEWCTVWKGSVKDCLDHLRSKHDGAQFLDMKTLGKFCESGCRLVNRYQIY